MYLSDLLNLLCKLTICSSMLLKLMAKNIAYIELHGYIPVYSALTIIINLLCKVGRYIYTSYAHTKVYKILRETVVKILFSWNCTMTFLLYGNHKNKYVL